MAACVHQVSMNLSIASNRLYRRQRLAKTSLFAKSLTH